jgi:RNA polymerase sigma-70 factor (ECF subfamily)
MAYRYVGGPHDAEDAVQDSLLSEHKHLDQFKATAKMTTWLTAIVTNSALTKLRKWIASSVDK